MFVRLGECPAFVWGILGRRICFRGKNFQGAGKGALKAEESFSGLVGGVGIGMILVLIREEVALSHSTGELSEVSSWEVHLGGWANENDPFLEKRWKMFLLVNRNLTEENILWIKPSPKASGRN